MNKDKRQQEIKRIVIETGKVTVNDLAAQLRVTPETIRRDLDELENNHDLTRIHGAAIPYSPGEVEMIFEKKLNVNYHAKRAIAKAAADMIKDGDTIAVDVGTTTIHIGDLIEQVANVTVITNSLAAAQTFNNAIEDGRMTGQVIVLPGVTNPSQASVKGSYTVSFLQKFHLDKAFISCGGVQENAVYDFDMEESLVSTSMIECSNQAILLVDQSKLDVRTLFEVAPMKDIDVVICNGAKPTHWASANYEWVEC